MLTAFHGQALKTNNRIVMAPMTRSRTSQPGDIPNEMMAEYYRQRASAGLIITEGAPVSAIARGYSMTPGIYTPEQIQGWKKSHSSCPSARGKNLCSALACGASQPCQYRRLTTFGTIGN